jgi:hypothetical protein
MNKPVLGLIAGGVLGAFDGLTALVSAPEVAPQIAGIVAGSMGKGLVAGFLIGWGTRAAWTARTAARRRQAVPRLAPVALASYPPVRRRRRVPALVRSTAGGWCRSVRPWSR